MIRKFILIVLIITGYIYLVSSDPKGDILNKAKNFYAFCFMKYKKMNLEYHVNKWPNKSKNKYFY